MKEILISWPEFKSSIINKGFPINYRTIFNNEGYEVFAIDRVVYWYSQLLDAEEIIDFEENYKQVANQYKDDLLRNDYKSNILNVTDFWQCVDLGTDFYDIILILVGDNNIEIKFNYDTADVIYLTTGCKKIEIYSLKVRKIYYKTINQEETSKLFYLVTR